jgi:hypothetical protein
MQRILIAVGLLLLVAGLFWPWLGKFPLGRLPGDILIERENMRIYFPITTLLLMSGLVTFLFWLFRK